MGGFTAGRSNAVTINLGLGLCYTLASWLNAIIRRCEDHLTQQKRHI